MSEDFTICEEQDIPWDALKLALRYEDLYIDEDCTRTRKVEHHEFMYMHTKFVEEYPRFFSRIDAFKHWRTRNYVYLINKRKIHVRYDAAFNRGYFGPSEEEINETLRHNPVLSGPEQAVQND
jgi:hypothetical protein